MLEGLRRELSNWPKRRKKTIENTLYIEELDGLLDALKRAGHASCSFTDVKCRAIKFYNPYAHEEKDDDVLYPYTIHPKLEQTIVGDLLDKVCRTQSMEEFQGFIVNVQHQVYAGKKDEKHYIDVFRRGKDKPGMPKVMSLEYTLVPS